MARAKILLVVRNLDVGGMERMIIELVNSIDRDQFESLLCTIEDPGQLADSLVASGTRLIPLQKGPGLSMRCVLKLRGVIKQEGIDLIHTHNETASFYATLANRLLLKPRPIIHTKHGRGTPDNKKSVIRNRLSSMLTDIVVAVSDDVKSLCHDLEWVPERKLRTIINGVGLDPYVRAAERRADRSEFVFGHIGRLSTVKNQGLLIRAFSQVQKSVPGARLVIVGDGSKRAELAALVKELDIEDEVDLAGYRSDIPEQLSGVDCFVLSSLSEGTPLVVIEAMAAGCPVIATDVGGLRAMIDEGETGFLVKSQDQQALAERMTFLANNKDECRRMGQKAQRNALDNYSVKDMARQYEDLYRSLHRA